MEKPGRTCRRLVLVPFPFQGHITPMLQLGTILHSKGFSITVAYSQFNSPETSEHPYFTFLSLSEASSPTPLISDHFLDFITNLNLNCRAPLQDALTQIIEEQEQQEELPCVIHDRGMYCAEAVARHLKIPSVILYTGSVISFLTYYAYPRLREDGYIPFHDSKLSEPVPGLHLLRYKDLPVSKFENLEALLRFIAIIQNIGASTAVIWNSMECLEQSSLVLFQQLYQVPIFFIGPMHKVAPTSSTSLLKEDTGCIAWLDKQTHNSVLYVSLGSIACVDEKELAEMARGIANCKQPFLWVLRPGSVNGSESSNLLLDDFKKSVGERGCIVTWAPQKQVLAHSAVGGFLSHCGWNSILESISEGVPMICRPCFADQRVNARYVSHAWRVGLELEKDLESAEIERAVKRLMVEKEGQEMRQRALDLKANVEVSINSGGSSFNSLNELVEHIISV